jgi:hypothetical protein
MVGSVEAGGDTLPPMSDDLAFSNSLNDLAARIRDEHRQTMIAVQRGLVHAMRCGELLLEAKAQVKKQYGHGHWQRWLKQFCAMTDRSARYCMRPARAKAEIGNVSEMSMRDAIKALAQRPCAFQNEDGKHYFLAPPDLMASLHAEFNFDFDACPHPRNGFDGLTTEWGQSNYVNPPFPAGVTAWVRKAIFEHHKGKRVVFVFPLDSWVLMLLAAGAKVRNLGERRHAVEDNQPGNGSARPIACFVLDTASATRHAGIQIGKRQTANAQSAQARTRRNGARVQGPAKAFTRPRTRC